MRLRIAAYVLASTVFMVVVTASPASASTSFTLRGTAICISGEPVVSVWIESSKGGSGLATITNLPGHQNAAYYSRLLTLDGTSTLASPTVSCGSSSNPSPGRVMSGTYIYNVRCDDPGACSGAPYPDGDTANHFPGGWCTWGAAYKWNLANKAHTKPYPSWYGDAYLWDDNAKNAKDGGFRVVTVPNERSIAVWEPYVGGAGSLGHVAWVTKVWVDGSTIWFRVREMNWDAWNAWDTRNVVYTRGMSFIIAPPGSPVV